MSVISLANQNKILMKIKTIQSHIYFNLFRDYIGWIVVLIDRLFG